VIRINISNNNPQKLANNELLDGELQNFYSSTAELYINHLDILWNGIFRQCKKRETCAIYPKKYSTASITKKFSIRSWKIPQLMRLT